MFREGIAAGLDFFVGGFDLGCLEWRLADELSIAGLGKSYIITPTDQTSTS